MTSETLYTKVRREGALLIRRFTRDNGTGWTQVDWQTPAAVCSETEYPTLSSGALLWDAPEQVPQWVKRTATIVVRRWASKAVVP